jgi:hypothetical protein
MTVVHDLILITHFIGVALIVGPFFLQMRSRENFAFPLVFTGTIIQLTTGGLLVGLLEMAAAADPDEVVNHAKVGVKLTLALIAFIAALIGYRRQKKAGGTEVERKLMPFFHTAGGLAVINIFIAVLW